MTLISMKLNDLLRYNNNKRYKLYVKKINLILFKLVLQIIDTMLSQSKDTEVWPNSIPPGSEAFKMKSLISELSKCLFVMQQHTHSRNTLYEIDIQNLIPTSLYETIEFKLNNIGMLI
jgi:hypothetical protein